MSALDALAARLRDEGGLLAAAAVDPPADAATPLGDAAAAGDPGYALLVEAIHEGYRQHYGGSRVLDGADPDLALLAGDHLYALGLAELADRGDLASVSVLAGVIARCAQAHAEGRPQDAVTAWHDGARTVGSRTEAV